MVSVYKIHSGGEQLANFAISQKIEIGNFLNILGYYNISGYYRYTAGYCNIRIIRNIYCKLRVSYPLDSFKNIILCMYSKVF